MRIRYILREPPDVILLALAGVLFLVLSGVYIVLSPPSLPAFLPGHVALRGAEDAQEAAQPTGAGAAPGGAGAGAGAASDTPTSVSIPSEGLTAEEQRAAFFETLRLNPEANALFWETVRQQQEGEAEAAKDPTYPTREWKYVVIALLLSLGAFALSWNLSGTRLIKMGVA